MKRVRIAAKILSAALAALVLAGCASGLAGSAIAAPVPSTVVVTPTLSATVQPPTTHAPVTVTQAPTTVTAAPSTVTQHGSTVGPDPGVGGGGNTGTTADDQIASDRSIADSTIGYWIPQLGSYTDSPSAMHRFDDVQASYPDAIMVWSGDYSSFRAGNFYVVMLPRTFSSASDVNSWLDGQGIQNELGFAKRLSHTDGADGNTVER